MEFMRVPSSMAAFSGCLFSQEKFNTCRVDGGSNYITELNMAWERVTWPCHLAGSLGQIRICTAGARAIIAVALVVRLMTLISREQVRLSSCW